MKFKLRPILSEIKDLYSKPISPDRFKEYIAKLQGGTKGDLALPISGFNPMAKNHILSKIEELEKLDAEKLIEATLDEFNLSTEVSNPECLVVLNIADDLKGGWTNYYSTDFDSKFKLNAFATRNFCVPYFWTSETYTKDKIRTRTIEYMYRTLYWLENPRPKTLQEHFAQEVYVASQTNQSNVESEDLSSKEIESFYFENKDSDEYSKIFNFFYGDEGSRSLGYKQYGINNLTGYNYAKLNSRKGKI